MPEAWTRERLQRYLDDQVQEALDLDYKGADALAKSDGKKKEIHKDVSAMANSAGGTLIYGIREYDDKERRHLPERFDPVDQSVFSKEWLEQVIGGIQPRLQGLVITPVSVGPNPNDAVFVVEVPASSTAHQAGDYRYYRRYNFESVPMNDYEVRDVMNRSTHALIDLEFKLRLEQVTVHTEGTEFTRGTGFMGSMTPQTVVKKTRERHARLEVFAENRGAVYAQYIVAYIYLPEAFSGETYPEKLGDGRVKVRLDNTKRDYIGHRSVHSREVPVLPGTREELGVVTLSYNYVQVGPEGARVDWEVYADNAQVHKGIAQMDDLKSVAEVELRTETRNPFDLLGR